MIVHKTMVHGRCPINGSWDYYTLEVRTDEFVRCEDIEEACDSVRGSEQTQERMAYELREKLPSHCVLVLQGRHGQNVQTMVEL
jgi:hypothetical protein